MHSTTGTFRPASTHSGTHPPRSPPAHPPAHSTLTNRPRRHALTRAPTHVSLTLPPDCCRTHSCTHPANQLPSHTREPATHQELPEQVVIRSFHDLSISRMWKQYASSVQWQAEASHAASLQTPAMPPRVSHSAEVTELTACCKSAVEQQKNIKEELRRLHRREH